jgi:hypothetical protein
VSDALLEDDEGPSEEQLVGQEADVPDVHLAILEERVADGPLRAALRLGFGGDVFSLAEIAQLDDALCVGMATSWQ